MDIDLFLTPQTEGGLVCGGAYAKPLAGIIFDAQTRELTLEYGDHSTFHLNIPMEERHVEKILMAQRMHVGFLDSGMLSDAYEVPLYYLNDPYGGDFGRNASLPSPRRAALAFQQFVKRCDFAQAMHRDNLADEGAARSVLRGVDPHTLQLTPALQRQMQLGTAPKVQTAPAAMPGTPGMGGSGTTRASGTLTGRQTDDSADKQ